MSKSPNQTVLYSRRQLPPSLCRRRAPSDAHKQFNCANFGAILCPFFCWFPGKMFYFKGCAGANPPRSHSFKLNIMQPISPPCILYMTSAGNHFLPYNLCFFIGINMFLCKVEKNPLPMETCVQKGLFSTLLASLKKTPANEICGCCRRYSR